MRDSERTSRHFLSWGVDAKIELAYIQPGKPVENAHVESFNRKLRDECLNVSWLETCGKRAHGPRHGEKSTTPNARTAVSDTKRQRRFGTPVLLRLQP